jgi:aspartate racemase
LAKHIGIVGVSPEGSATCYKRIGRRASEIADPAERPSITLHNLPFSSYVEAIKADDWQRDAAMLRQSAEVLERAGADFCVLPDNVTHHALQLAEAGSPLPWLNMIALVTDAIEANRCKHVGLIGTRYVTFGSTYQTMLGLRKIKLHVPDEQDAVAIDRIIFGEAIYGRVRPESIELVNGVIEKLAARGCEALILGASEATNMLNTHTLRLPLFDPVELLAEAAVAHATRTAEVA